MVIVLIGSGVFSFVVHIGIIFVIIDSALFYCLIAAKHVI